MNAPTSTASRPAFDPAILAGLRSLAQETDPALFTEILCTLRDDVAKYLGAIRQAVAERDTVVLEHTAHAMKGAGRNTGALALATLSEQIEDAAEAGNLAGVPPLLAGLEDEARRVQADIELELARPN